MRRERGKEGVLRGKASRFFFLSSFVFLGGIDGLIALL